MARGAALLEEGCDLPVEGRPPFSNWLNRRRWFRRRLLSPDHFGQPRRIQSCILPGRAVAGRVRAERRIIGAARVGNRVTRLAGLIESRTVLGEPVRAEMRLRLIARCEREGWLYNVRPSDRRNGMAQVAFQPDGLLILIQVLAVMAAPAARPIRVADVIRVCLPVDPLIPEHCVRIDVEDSLDRLI